MSNLLIEEPPLQVLPSLALAVGLNEALILQQMHYWLKVKQQSSDKFAESFRDGRWWVYNSVEQWKSQFPFWSADTISRAITSLRKQGVLIVAQLADDSRDRTNWYTIDYDKVKSLAVPVFNKRQSKAPKRGNALPQIAVMGEPQNAPVHNRKMRQCLTETSSENTQKIHQRVAPAGAQSFSPSFSQIAEQKEQKEPAPVRVTAPAPKPDQLPERLDPNFHTPIMVAYRQARREMVCPEFIRKKGRPSNSEDWMARAREIVAEAEKEAV